MRPLHALTFSATIIHTTLAYIPAQATNQTIDTPDAGSNASNVSSIVIQWHPDGSFAETVSYQLTASGSQGVSQGVLVHFSEDRLVASDVAATPWIALICCDSNATRTDYDVDIFTLARDRGATAAVLYSTVAQSCTINPFYADPTRWDHVLDVYATWTLAASQLIESEFSAVGVEQDSEFYSFNATALNASALVVADAIANHTVSKPGLLFATLIAANATNVPSGIPSAATSHPSPFNTPSGSSTSSLKAGIIAVIVFACILAACILAVVIWQVHLRRRWRTPAVSASAPAVEMREAAGAEGVQRPSRRVVRFSADRLVRLPSSLPERAPALDVIEEVRREEGGQVGEGRMGGAVQGVAGKSQ